jgi:NAD(P)-dependent dehydrogenase (short-subunit alcohol dehydrogenase family)
MYAPIFQMRNPPTMRYGDSSNSFHTNPNPKGALQVDLGLQGKVAVITGGSDGIGKAAATALASEGAQVVICARRADVLEEAAAEISAATGGKVVAIAADVTQADQVKQLMEKTLDLFGRIDILVNNAGTSAAHPFEAATDEIWEADIQLKLMGAIYCIRAAVPHMKAQGSGRIINITTPGGKAPGPRSVPTSVTRAAGIALTKALSKEYAPYNILVNTVCVGVYKSGQQRRRWERMRADNPDLTLEAFYKEMGKNVPLGRVGEAREAGDVIAFLASERASYITGSAINADGGTSPVV